MTTVPERGLADRRAVRPGVRRRLVVRRSAGVHPPGAGPLRRGDGPRRASLARSRRPGTRARPGARALRDRRPRGRLAWMDAGSPATARAPTAWSTSPGTRRCTSCPTGRPRGGAGPLRGPARRRRPRSAAGPWSTRVLAAVALGADAGARRDVPGVDGGARRTSTRHCSDVRRRRSWRCTRRSRSAPPATRPGCPPCRQLRRGAPTRSQARGGPPRCARACAGWSSATRPARPTTSGRSRTRLSKVGGSDAQREVVEETRICALLRAGAGPDEADRAGRHAAWTGASATRPVVREARRRRRGPTVDRSHAALRRASRLEALRSGRADVRGHLTRIAIVLTRPGAGPGHAAGPGSRVAAVAALHLITPALDRGDHAPLVACRSAENALNVARAGCVTTICVGRPGSALPPSTGTSRGLRRARCRSLVAARRSADRVGAAGRCRRQRPRAGDRATRAPPQSVERRSGP